MLNVILALSMAALTGQEQIRWVDFDRAPRYAEKARRLTRNTAATNFPAGWRAPSR